MPAKINQERQNYITSTANSDRSLRLPNPTEAKTRKELIDPALQKAGWDVDNPDQVGIEIPVDGFDPVAWQRLEVKLRRLREAGVAYEVELPAGVSDYVLFRPNGEIIAVVEAKRTSINPRLARAQTEFYVTELEKRQSFRPFGFMTNGAGNSLLGRRPGQSAGGAGLFLAAGSGEPALPAPEPDAADRGDHQHGHYRPDLPTAGHPPGERGF